MNDKTVFRAHPVYVYNFLKRFVFILVLPVLKGAVQYVLYREISDVLMLEFLALGIITALSVARVLCFKITVNGEFLQIEDGIFFRKKAVIPLFNVSSITVTRHLLLDLVGAQSVSVNTEVGIYGRKDFEFKLYKKDAEELEKLIYGKKPKTELRFLARRIALLSASASSALTGLIVGVPVINRIGKLLNVGVMNILTDITDFSKSVRTYFPPAVNVITVLFLIIYGLSFIIALCRNFFFRIGTDKEKIEIMSGLYFRKRRIFKKSAVNNLCIDQTPLMHLFKTSTARVSIGGYGGEKGERSTVVPAMNEKLIKSRFCADFPQLLVTPTFITPRQNGLTRQRFLLPAHIITIAAAGTGAALTLLFPSFDRLFLFGVIVALCLNGYYAYVSVRTHRETGISFEKTVVARCSVRFTVRELYADAERIGKIKITRTPADRRLKTCNVTVTVRSESSDKARVRNVPLLPITEKINELYGIEI